MGLLSCFRPDDSLLAESGRSKAGGITIEVTIHSALETLVGSEGMLPLILTGAPLRGQVQVINTSGRAVPGGLKIAAIAWKRLDHYGEDNSLQVLRVGESLHISARKLAECMGTGEPIPFILPASSIAPIPTYVGGGYTVCHSVRATLHGSLPEFFGRFSTIGASAQPFALQCVAEPPTASLPKAERAWLTVCDLGGEVRLELSGWDVIDIGSPLRAKLTCTGEPKKLDAIYVRLCVNECGSDELRTVRELDITSQVNIKRLIGGEDIEVTLDLGEDGGDAIVYPSIPELPHRGGSAPAGSTFSALHCVRVVLEPEYGEDVWNSLPVTLVRSSAQGEESAVRSSGQARVSTVRVAGADRRISFAGGKKEEVRAGRVSKAEMKEHRLSMRRMKTGGELSLESSKI